MNELLQQYQEELRKKSEKVISSLNRKKDVLGLSYEELQEEIKKSIASDILPIADRYDDEHGTEIDINTPLQEISAKIRSAFVPETKAEKTLGRDDDDEDETELVDIESSQAYKKILEKIDFQTQAISEIERIKEELKTNPDYPKDDLIASLAPFLDLFFNAGIRVDFVVTVTSDGSGETEELHKNDTMLLKDIAMAIKLNKEAKNPKAKKDIESFTNSVFGRLQIPENSIPSSSKKIVAALVENFLILAPDFKKLKPSIIQQAAEISKDKKGVYEGSINKIRKNYDRLFTPKSEALKNVLYTFGENLVNRGYEKKKINKKKQEDLTDELSDQIKSVLMELGEVRRPALEKKNNLVEALDLIKTYEKTMRKRSLTEQDKDDLKKDFVFKIRRLIKSLDIKKEQLDDPEELKRIEQEINADLNSTQSSLEMYDFFQAQLIEQKNKFIEEWGLDEFAKDIESRDVDSLSPWEIIKYIIKKEVAFWTPLHQESDNEFLRQLVDKVKYNFMGDGNGYESNGSRMGTDNDEWSTSEGRTIMGLLQTYALFATLIHGEHYAEGKKDELFNALRSYKITRENLYTETLGHPVYGKYLTKILWISQYLPTLREGSLPNDEVLEDPNDLNPLKERMKDQFTTFERRVKTQKAKLKEELIRKLGREPSNEELNEEFKAKWKNRVVLHERNVIRNGKSIKLAADRFVKDSEGDWAFYPGEETLPGDKVILTSDPEFSYFTLSGNIGRSVAEKLHKTAAAMIEKNPELYGLTKNDIPKDENNLFAAQAFAQFLFYSFPFLTKIYADYELQTQTASHAVKSEFMNWNKLFSPLGEAIQDADRYGLRSSLMWIFVYYTKFKDGAFGASGNATRINRIQELMKAHQRFVFGEDAMSHIAGQLNVHKNFGLPMGFTTPLDMLQIAKGESSRLFGNIMYENGRVDPGSFEKPHKIGPEGTVDQEQRESDGSLIKPKPAYDWDLFVLSAKAYLKLLETTIKDIEVGSLTIHDLEEGELNPITQLLFKVMGQFKMWFFGDESSPANILKESSPLVFHAFLRHAYATKRERPADVVKIFSNIMKSVESSLGYTGSGSKVARGLGDGPVSKSVATVHKWMRGEHEVIKDGKKEIVRDKRLYSDGKANWAETLVRNVFNGSPMLDPKISDGFTPISGSVFDARQPLLIDYLKLLWEDLSEEYKTKENPDGLGNWPFKIVADVGVKYVVIAPDQVPIKLSGKTTEWTETVDWFRAQLMREQPVSSPLKRPKFD